MRIHRATANTDIPRSVASPVSSLRVRSQMEGRDGCEAPLAPVYAARYYRQSYPLGARLLGLPPFLHDTTWGDDIWMGTAGPSSSLPSFSIDHLAALFSLFFKKSKFKFSKKRFFYQELIVRVARFPPRPFCAGSVVRIASGSENSKLW